MFFNLLSASINVIGIITNLILIFFTITGISFPKSSLGISAKSIISLVSGFALFYFNVFFLVYIFNKYENKLTNIERSEREMGREFFVYFCITSIIWTPQFLCWRLWYKGELEFWSTFVCTLLGIIVVLFSAAALAEYLKPYSEKKRNEGEK